MFLKIVVRDSINGIHTPIRMEALNTMYEEIFYLNPHTLTDEQLETITLHVEQKCNYRNCLLNYYESSDGLLWKHGVTLKNN